MIIHIKQDVEIDDLLEDIHFAKEMAFGSAMGRCELVLEVIPLDNLFSILQKHFPQLNLEEHGDNAGHNT